MGFKVSNKDKIRDRIRKSRGHGRIEKTRPGRRSDYGGDDYETMGTKRKDRIRGYRVNNNEMYSQWYEKYDDNSTQGKSRRGIRLRSKDDDYLIGTKGWEAFPQGKGDDYLLGGRGHDRLSGGKGDDELLGGRGHDRLSGGKGDDYLIGGEGNDYLKGGKGDDILIGGKGKDKLIGGKGADVFDVKSETEKGSKCVIKDFNPDEGDKISAADKVSIEMKGDKAIIEADGATTICRLDSDYRPNNAKTLDDWFTDSTIVDVVEG